MRRGHAPRRLAALAAGMVLVGCRSEPGPASAQAESRPPAAPPAAPPTATGAQAVVPAALAGEGPCLLDLDGRPHHPLAPPAGRASVLCFVTTDCPIANAYAPALQALADDLTEAPLDFYLVHVDPDAEPEAVRAHAREYGLRATILLDPRQTLAQALGITCTPEAAVVTGGGELSYRGRIDDRYRALGRRRPQATRRDLREHLEALVGPGPPPEPVRTEAVGCLLPTPRADEPAR